MTAPYRSESGVYLRTYLQPFAPWLEHPDVTDILVNQPGEVWVETIDQPMRRFDAPDVTGTMMQRLAQQAAAFAAQGVNREHPLLSAALPDGARLQIAGPPATRGPMALAIRKHLVADLTLEALEAAGAFALARENQFARENTEDGELHRMLDAGAHAQFLRAAIRRGRTILVAGATGAGKTTFLNTLVKEIPFTERLILIEDTPEVRVSQPNAVGLLAVKGHQGEARVQVGDLLEAALRMRPDRLLVGEIRGAEALTFLRAIGTGHKGSITTVHADSPRAALEQIAFMAGQSGAPITRAEIIAYAREAIDVIVQLARIGGRRVVAGVVSLRRGDMSDLR
jgi:type IV secretion system protein VirB11